LHKGFDVVEKTRPNKIPPAIVTILDIILNESKFRLKYANALFVGPPIRTGIAPYRKDIRGIAMRLLVWK
jgi:hypothetical protein